MDTSQPQYRQHGIYGDAIQLFNLAVSIQILVFIAITLRFVSRRMSKAGIGTDDWAALVAVFFDVILTSLAIAEVFFGYGYPGSSLSPSDETTVLTLFWLTQIFYKIVTGCCKLSFCLFYFRVFPPKSHRKFRRWNLAVMILITGYSMASPIITIFQCTPMGRIWDKSIEGTCIDLTAFWLANAVYNIFTDVMIILLPCIMCRGLQVSKKDKIGLLVIFSVGIFVIGTSVARVTTLDIASKSVDPSQGTLLSNKWTTVEANTAIIVACLPSFKAPIAWLFRRVKPAAQSPLYSNNEPKYFGRPDSRIMNPSELGEIAIRTDVNIEIEERSSNSSGLTALKHEIKTRTREII